MIVMMVRNKDRSDLSDINTSLRKTARDAVAGIDDIILPLTVKRLDDCARSGRSDGPAAVPRLLLLVLWRFQGTMGISRDDHYWET